MPHPPRVRPLSLAALMSLAALATLAAPARAGDVSKADRDYLEKDASGASYELALAKLAAERASRPEVKQFAATMASDHERYNDALTALAREKGLDISKQMGTVDEVKLAAIKALSGSLFDKAFLEQAQSINADDIKDAKAEEGATKDPQIKAFVARFASMDEKHEAQARALRQ